MSQVQAPSPRNRSPYANDTERKRIQEEDAKLKMAEEAKRVPEKNKAKDLAYFAIGRYVEGPFRGLFLVSQMITEDEKGKKLKSPTRKIVADGVDIVVAISSLENALRRKVFR